MLKKIIISTAVAASALTALPAAAEAQSRYGYSSRYDNGYYNQGYGRSYQGQRYDRRYANQRYYNQRTYNGGYYNHYGPRCSGSTGTILGAIAGGLLGSEVAGPRRPHARRDPRRRRRRPRRPRDRFSGKA